RSSDLFLNYQQFVKKQLKRSILCSSLLTSTQDFDLFLLPIVLPDFCCVDSSSISISFSSEEPTLFSSSDTSDLPISALNCLTSSLARNFSALASISIASVSTLSSSHSIRASFLAVCSLLRPSIFCWF